MNDNYNGRPVGSDEDALRRAERINAIKRSVREASGAVKLEERPSAPVNAARESWDAGLNERIERRSENAPSDRRMSIESILSELDSYEKVMSEKGDDAARIAAQVIRDKEEAAERRASEEPSAEKIPEKREPREIRKLERVQRTAPISHEKEPSETEKTAVTETENTAAPKKKKKKKKKTLKQRIRGLFPEKGDSILERIRKLVYIGALAVIVVCTYMISDYYIDLWRSERENSKYMDNYWDHVENIVPTQPSTIDEVDNRKIYTLLDGAKYFLGINDEVVGVIRIPDTPVNNPVLQAKDNDKYLDKKMNGRESRAGEIFLDYRNSFDRVDSEGHLAEPNSDNLVIYGHNMKDEQMFGCLKSYERNVNFYGEHPVIELNSNYEQYKYKIFSVFLLDAKDESETKFDCWNGINFDSEEEFYDYVNEAKKRSFRLNDVDVKYGDPLVTLSTCNTLLGDRGRLIVMGRLVRDGEDPLEGTQNSTANPNIKWPTLYYTYRPSAKKYDPEAEFVPYGQGTEKPAETEKATEPENKS